MFYALILIKIQFLMRWCIYGKQTSSAIYIHCVNISNRFCFCFDSVFLLSLALFLIEIGSIILLQKIIKMIIFSKDNKVFRWYSFMNIILLSRCLILFYIHFKINLPFHSFATKGYVSEFIWKSFCSPNLSVISLYQKRWITCVLLLNIKCLLLNGHCIDSKNILAE